MPAFAVSRRFFVAAAGGAVVLPLGGGAWAAAAEGGRKRLVVILLRGAVDGLNVVVPFGDPAYYAARPTIAIARPGTADGALALDGHFGAAPGARRPAAAVARRQLAFIHAAGSPDPNRSHFEAQRYIENGTPGGSSDAGRLDEPAAAGAAGPARADRRAQRRPDPAAHPERHRRRSPTWRSAPPQRRRCRSTGRKLAAAFDRSMPARLARPCLSRGPRPRAPS